MEEKKAVKISLSTLFLILAVIVIIIMAVFIIKLNNEKLAETEKSAQLQAQVNSLNGTVDNLQGKIDSISKTINSNSANSQVNTNSSSSTDNSNSKTNAESTKGNKIILEGTYSEGAVGYVYEFHNDGTILEGDELVDSTGTYETIGEKQIKVTLTEKTTSNMDTPEKKLKR